MHRFEELKIWQKAMVVTEKCYAITSEFPVEEKYGLISQIRRSAVAIPSNISEGAGRNTNGEFRQFLGVANGSSFELLTQLYLSKRLKLISERNVRPIIDEVVEVTKMNYSLQKTLQ
ncbi:four helix bundle protein [Galbibacter sp. BG1]|uniref:four helix bundle protein n=1 Tax=Galbibacter sp. BG1 TaxID=1170699 RepID=UPI0015BA91F0|nr:four helix bundle protein [Galbibacter sp. BG1]QLE00109.1 four helix bundle protein [Galbibacter sp. BG1]